jgi:hypothetical protein
MPKANYMLNPNPHCFIAITKAAARGSKYPLLPQTPAQPCGGGGGVLPL